jgi:TniQ
MTLPVQPIPFADESPAGYILRVAYRNGWPSPNAFISALGGAVCHKGISRARLLHHFDLLSLFGLDVPDGLTEPCTARRVFPKRYRLADGIDLPLDAFRDDCSAICPECLKSSNHIRQIWSLNCYTICHIHGVHLLRSCPACELSLTYHRSAPHLCSCGADLSCFAAVVGDIGTAEKLNRLVKGQRQEDLTLAVETFSACCEAFEGDTEGDIFSLAQYTSAAVAERDHLVLWLAERIRSKSRFAHPRLLLVPFLRSTAVLRDAAVRVLRLLGDACHVALSDEKMPGHLSRRDTCLALGLNSHRVIAKLGQQGLLSDTPFNSADRGLVVSRDHVNRLLVGLYRPDRDSTIPVTALTTPIDELIRTGLNVPESVIGYDLIAGLTTFRLHPAMVGRKADAPPGYVSLSQVARRLCIHKDVVRSATRLGYIKAVPGRRGTSPLIFDREEISKFDDKFVFASSLARALGVDPMKFSTKLFAADIKPVGGPTINGLLVYLFHRSDLAQVHLRVLAAGKSVRFSGVGRFVDLVKMLEAVQPSISISEIAEELSLPYTEVAKIVRAGCLKRVAVPGPEVRVCRKSYAEYQSAFRDQNLIEVSQAAQLSGETLIEFRTNWIDTGFVKVIDLGIRKCVSQDEFLKVKAVREKYVTARQARQATGGMQKARHTLPNLEKRGGIASVRAGSGRKIKLFDRNEAKSALG